MQIKQFIVGQLEVNCWVISDEETRETMVIDPGDEPDRILEWVQEKDLQVTSIFCTHSHFDHVGALPDLAEALAVEVVLHEGEKGIYEMAHQMARSWGFEIDPLPAPGRLVKDGDEVAIGTLKLKVIHTPGHSPGGCCLYGEGQLFSGDTLFAGSIGRTDLPGGSYETLMASLGRLAVLPDETAVHPGHGPSSTIAQEKRSNPYLGGGI